MTSKKKKCLIVLVVVLVSSIFVLCGRVFAATCGGVDTSIISCEEGGDGGIYHILELVIDILSIGIGILAVIGIMWAGVLYLTSKDNTEKTLKSKRRIYEIVIGVALYAVLYGFIRWLTPGAVTDLSQDNTGVESVKISFSGTGTVGKTIIPKVAFDKKAKNKTYSLTSNNDNVIRTLGNAVKCVDEGEAKVTVLTANGKKASTKIRCIEEKNPNSDYDTTARDGSNNVILGSMVNTKFEGNSKGKPHVRKVTKEIIKNHNEDFFYTGNKSYSKVVLGKNSKYGSYEKYVRSLGGIFSDFAGTSRIKVKTAADYQIAAEYVFGLMMIWGPDYYNGDSRQIWNRDDAFYSNYGGRYSKGYVSLNMNVNKVLKNNSAYTGGDETINIHCDKGINILYRSLSLKWPGGTSYWRTNQPLKKYIRSVDKLQVGDVVNFPGHHTVSVGEVYEDKVVLYDVGNWFQTSHTYKKVISRKTGTRRFSDRYSGYSEWIGWRLKSWEIDQSKTLGGMN